MDNLFRIFYAPGDVFAGIPERSRWQLPFFSVLALSCLTSALIIHSIGMDNLLRKQFQSQPRLVEQLGEEKIEAIIQQANTPARRISTYIGSIISISVVVLVVAAVLTGLLSLLGAGAGFRKVFSVTAYSYFAYYLVSLALSAIVIFSIGDKDSIDVENLLQGHAGAFLDRATTNKALYSIASSVDIFSFGLLFLMALGLSRVSKRLSNGYNYHYADQCLISSTRIRNRKRKCLQLSCRRVYVLSELC
jgi:hypothetical protein